MEVSKTDSNVIRVRTPFVRNKTWEQWVLVRSDVHHDNPHCKQDLEKKHLDEALARDAMILDIGDAFCAMQGRYDPRSSKASLREEHKVNNYLDALVSTYADFLEPYAQNFVFMGRGNHETGILKRLETDLTDRLVTTLKDRTSTQMQVGGYSGWLWLQFVDGPDGAKPHIRTKRLWYHHGSGGNSPVTKGVIQHNRRLTYVEGADVIASGHIHQHWSLRTSSLFIDHDGIQRKRDVVHIQSSTYKDEFDDGSEGWSIEKGFAPSPLGPWWLRFYWANDEVNVQAIPPA